MKKPQTVEGRLMLVLALVSLLGGVIFVVALKYDTNSETSTATTTTTEILLDFNPKASVQP